MTQDIRAFVTPSCTLLGLGEPTHQEPAFPLIRNDLFAQLAEHGFRSIVLETDRVAALTVNDYVQGGAGDLDSVMREGFSHGFGEGDANRRLVAWMREYNRDRSPEERLTFHGFDAPTESFNAPSPQRYLEHARDYLGLDLDIAGMAGPDEQWSRTEAVMDAAKSIGDTAEAEKLRAVADDMLVWLYGRAPELIAKTSRDEWFRAKTHLTAGLGLLRYHKQCAKPLERNDRVSRLLGLRDALMAQNLLDIRDIEARRGPTLVFAANAHLQRTPSRWRTADMDFNWVSAGAIVASLLDDQYVFVAGSLGSSEAMGLGAADADTYEGVLRRRTTTWGLTPAVSVAAARTRTDITPQQGYFPLDEPIVDTSEAILHIN